MAALRDAAVGGPERNGRRTAVGTGLLAVGIAAILGAVAGSSDDMVLLVGFGALACLSGVVALGPAAARPAGPPRGGARPRGGGGGGGGGPPPPHTPPPRGAGGAPVAHAVGVFNAGAAEDAGLTVGDRATVLVPGPVEVEVVGLVDYAGDVGTVETTFTGFTLEAAQQHIAGGDGRIHEILVEAAPGGPRTSWWRGWKGSSRNTWRSSAGRR
jgi:hypothetical protein